MLLFLVLLCVFVKVSESSCATKEFMSCVVQLNAHKVQFDTNIMNVIYNITTEAKLMHTCKTYERVLPCFDQRIAVCGTKGQKSMLEKGKRLHSYLCAPFSMQRQKIFLRQGTCIQKVLKEPIDSKCDKPYGLMVQKLQSCRSRCGDDLVCNTKTDISELASCTYMRIESQCGIEAAQFFSQMQQVLTSREYPVQCSYSLRGVTAPTINNTTTKPKLTETKETKIQRSNPSYMSTSYVTVYPQAISKQNTSTLRRTDPRTSKIRSRNYVNLFSPARNQSKKSPSAQIAEVTYTTRLTLSPLTTTSTLASIEIPMPLHGARPIPETTIFIPTTLASKFKPNPFTKFLTTTTLQPLTAVTPSVVYHKQSSTITTDPKWVPWYYQSKEQGSAPTNPMVAPFLDSTVYPTLLPPIPMPLESPIQSNNVVVGPSSPPFKFVFNAEPTPQPFKININWMDDPDAESPWYQQTGPQSRDGVSTIPSGIGPFAAVEPLLNQLKAQPLNFTEMGNQASNYFSAALSAFSSAAQESRNEATLTNNPWRSIIDAVAPTIQRVSPDIIPMIKEEIARLEPN